MSKLMSLREAVERFLPDGSSVVAGTNLESLIPYAAGLEIIRARRRDLTLIGPISDILFDILIGAGCARKLIVAWAGNVSQGLGHNYRRATEEGLPHRIEVDDQSNFSICLGLKAGALGLPYLPTRTLLGTDILHRSCSLRPSASPFDGSPLVLVPALVPDVAILAVQRADAEGNAHQWGHLGVTAEAALASRRIILLAEEIVDAEVIRSDPNRVLVPGFRVSAVVHEPGGCHPSPVSGCYNRDHAFYEEYHRETRTREGFGAWLQRWAYEADSRPAYLARLGAARWSALAKRASRLAAPVDYGY
jgi:glutaconate CoA-transferase subunit A